MDTNLQLKSLSLINLRLTWWTVRCRAVSSAGGYAVATPGNGPEWPQGSSWRRSGLCKSRYPPRPASRGCSTVGRAETDLKTPQTESHKSNMRSWKLKDRSFFHHRKSLLGLELREEASMLALLHQSTLRGECEMCENLQLGCEDSQLKLDFLSERTFPSLTGQSPVRKEQIVSGQISYSCVLLWKYSITVFLVLKHARLSGLEGEVNKCYKDFNFFCCSSLSFQSKNIQLNHFNTGTQTYLIHMIRNFKHSGLHRPLTAKLLVLKGELRINQWCI